MVQYLAHWILIFLLPLSLPGPHFLHFVKLTGPGSYISFKCTGPQLPCSLYTHWGPGSLKRPVFPMYSFNYNGTPVPMFPLNTLDRGPHIPFVDIMLLVSMHPLNYTGVQLQCSL